jgi:hypothetical protein
MYLRIVQEARHNVDGYQLGQTTLVRIVGREIPFAGAIGPDSEVAAAFFSPGAGPRLELLPFRRRTKRNLGPLLWLTSEGAVHARTKGSSPFGLRAMLRVDQPVTNK